MITDTVRANPCRRKFKAMITNKSTKNEGPSKDKFHEKKPFEDFRRKKYTSGLDQTTPWNTRPLNATIETGPCNQEERNRTQPIVLLLGFL